MLRDASTHLTLQRLILQALQRLPEVIRLHELQVATPRGRTPAAVFAGLVDSGGVGLVVPAREFAICLLATAFGLLTLLLLALCITNEKRATAAS